MDAVLQQESLELLGGDLLLDKNLIRDLAFVKQRWWDDTSFKLTGLIKVQLRDWGKLTVDLSLKVSFDHAESLWVGCDLFFDRACDQVNDNGRMYFEEVEILHAGVTQVLDQTGHINLIVAIEVKVYAQLVHLRIKDKNAVIVKDVSQLGSSNLGFIRCLLDLLYEFFILLWLRDLPLHAVIDPLKQIMDTSLYRLIVA